MRHINWMVQSLMNSLNLIVYDFDGVMTDNKVYVNQEGQEMVQVNRGDGLGISLIKKLGIKQIILSTETNPVVSVRAKKLNIDCFQGADDKVMMLKKYCSQYDYHLKKVGYVGNDINDMEAMKIVEYSFCPADAHPDILNISKFILKSNGGGGVIRELYDLINLKSIFNHSN